MALNADINILEDAAASHAIDGSQVGTTTNSNGDTIPIIRQHAAVAPLAGALFEVSADAVEALLATISGKLGSLEFTSLNAANAPAAGSALVLATARQVVSMEITTAGTVTIATVALDVSLGGAAWTTLRTWTLGDDPLVIVAEVAVTRVRARLTAFTGTGTLTAIVAGA